MAAIVRKVIFEKRKVTKSLLPVLLFTRHKTIKNKLIQSNFSFFPQFFFIRSPFTFNLLLPVNQLSLHLSQNFTKKCMLSCMLSSMQSVNNCHDSVHTHHTCRYSYNSHCLCTQLPLHCIQFIMTYCRHLVVVACNHRKWACQWAWLTDPFRLCSSHCLLDVQTGCEPLRLKWNKNHKIIRCQKELQLTYCSNNNQMCI